MPRPSWSSKTAYISLWASPANDVKEARNHVHSVWSVRCDDSVFLEPLSPVKPPGICSRRSGYRGAALYINIIICCFRGPDGGTQVPLAALVDL